MRIVLSEPSGPYSCTLDAGVMDVKLIEVFNGVQFISDSGEKLSVSMRDSGFEIHYFKDEGAVEFDCGWFDFKNATPLHRMGT
jgi:hypothetical protein